MINTDTVGSTTAVTTLAGGGNLVVLDRPGTAPTTFVVTPSTTTTNVTLPGTTTQLQLPANASVVQSVEVLPTIVAGASKDVVVQQTRAAVIGNITDAIGAQVSVSGGNSQAVADLTISIDQGLTTVLNVFASNTNIVNTGGPSQTVVASSFDSFVYTSPVYLGLTSISSGNISGISDGSDTVSGADSLVGANEILINTSNSTSKELYAVNLSLANKATVVLQGIEGAVLAAPGNVRNEGNAPILISSDFQAQSIAGGGGNDTLIGTGNDSLTGGTGNDIFGIKGAGKYTITDFNKAGDTIAFQMDGVTNLTQLKAKITSVVSGTNSVTFNFGADTSVTLVGVTAADLTAGMIKFSFT